MQGIDAVCIRRPCSSLALSNAVQSSVRQLSRATRPSRSVCRIEQRNIELGVRNLPECSRFLGLNGKQITLSFKKSTWLVVKAKGNDMETEVTPKAEENGSPRRAPGRGPVVMELPLTQIRRPLLRTRNNDQEKVRALMDSIAEIGLQEPIDVLEVDGIFYGFSGCHRFEAHQKLGLQTIKCKVRRGTKSTLRMHMM